MDTSLINVIDLHAIDSCPRKMTTVQFSAWVYPVHRVSGKGTSRGQVSRSIDRCVIVCSYTPIDPELIYI